MKNVKTNLKNMVINNDSIQPLYVAKIFFSEFESWDQYWNALQTQYKHLIKNIVMMNLKQIILKN